MQQVQATIQDGELVLHGRVMRQVEKIRGGIDPVDLPEALLTTRDVARCCRDGPGNGHSPVDHFGERGITRRSDVSDIAKPRYASDYTLKIEQDGELRRVLMGSHVDLSVRHGIYWYHDKEAGRFVIGDHLRDASTR